MAYRKTDYRGLIKADLQRGKAAGVDKLFDEFKERLSTPVSGDEEAGVEPRRSLPGEYPRKDSGELVKSLYKAENGVGATAEHVIYLEFKTPEEGGRQPFAMAAADEDLWREVALAVVKGIENA